jgi:aspartyl-tRNA(Asn)/glutamyl-tRNA(Gln) amidotransferase subunit C
MVIDNTLLSKLEKLSYLEIASEKRTIIEKELSEILNFVENLKELETDEFESKFTMLKDAKAYLREDIVSQDEEIGKSIISNSPRSEDNFFVVPKIIE